jgi:hypothetical protein
MKSSARESKSNANALKKVADFFKSLLTNKKSYDIIKSSKERKYNYDEERNVQPDRNC